MLTRKQRRKQRGGNCPCKSKMFGGKRTRSISLLSRLRKVFRF